MHGNLNASVKNKYQEQITYFISLTLIWYQRTI
jgi:hypothetical protein